MSDTTFEVGQQVTILDVNKVGEIVSVSDDGQFTVKYMDDAGAAQNETVTADKLSAIPAEGSPETKPDSSEDDEEEEAED